MNSAYEILGDAEKRGQFDRGEIDAEGKPRFQGFEGFGGGGARRSARRIHFGFGGGNPSARRSARRSRRRCRRRTSSPRFSARRSARPEPRAAAGRAPSAEGRGLEPTLTVTLEEVGEEAKKRIRLPTGREVDVVIPKGVSDGQVIRLRGLGQGAPGVEPGDVLLTIKIAPHERFTLEGSNLRLRLPIEIEEAVLGGSVRVPTLTGAVR